MQTESQYQHTQNSFSQVAVTTNNVNETQHQHTQNSFSQVAVTTINSKKSKISKNSKDSKNSRSKASKFSKSIDNKLQNIETPLHKSNEVENPELEQINIKKVEIIDKTEQAKAYKIKTQSLKSILEKLHELENKPPSYNEVVQCFHEGKFFQLTEN